MQKEFHWKTAVWMCNNFKRIVIPQFESKKMSNKTKRIITTKTVRNMSTLAHGKFLERLKTKAEELNCEIVIVKEDRTTMTCGKCNTLNYNIKDKQEWICNECKHYHDRDCNASRNILQKQFQ